MATRPRRRLSITAVALGLVATACSSAGDDREAERSTGAPASTDQLQNADSSEASDSDDAAAPTPSVDPVVSDTDCLSAADPGDDGVQASVDVEPVGEFDGGTVHAASYPLPDELGTPWSQWGQGVVLPDGRFVSGVGDHRGQDGRSWFYEFDPASGRLARTTEVGSALGHEAGDWGYGKIHAPMVLDGCDRVITSTYWGSRRGLVLGGSYTGDHIIRYDPSTRKLDSLGVPVEGHGIPSLAMSPDRSRIFVEAVDPESEPDAGVFAVIDPRDGEVLEVDDSADHVGFRDVLVTGAGTAFYATSDSGIRGVDADGAAVEEPGVFGGGWLRSASQPAADGSVAVVTRSPDALFSRDADGAMAKLREFDSYVASIALAPDGRTVYYVPGAHGDSYELGTPLRTTDLLTGETNEIVRLNDLVEPVLGIGLGGTYNVVVDPSGDRVYIGLNGSSNAPDEKFGDVVLAIVEFDRS